MFSVCVDALASKGKLIIIGMMSQYASGWAPSSYPGLTGRQDRGLRYVSVVGWCTGSHSCCHSCWCSLRQALPSSTTHPAQEPEALGASWSRSTACDRARGRLAVTVHCLYMYASAPVPLSATTKGLPSSGRYIYTAPNQLVAAPAHSLVHGMTFPRLTAGGLMQQVLHGIQATRVSMSLAACWLYAKGFTAGCVY